MTLDTIPSRAVPAPAACNAERKLPQTDGRYLKLSPTCYLFVLCHRILCIIERFQALCTAASPTFPSYTVILGCLTTASFAHTLRVHTDTAACALQRHSSILCA
jgi:hypothetical protein